MSAALHVVAIGLFLSFPFALIAWIFFWPIRHTQARRDCSHEVRDLLGDLPTVPTINSPHHVDGDTL